MSSSVAVRSPFIQPIKEPSDAFDVGPVAGASGKGFVNQQILCGTSPELRIFRKRSQRASRDRAILEFHGPQGDIHMGSLGVFKKQNPVFERKVPCVGQSRLKGRSQEQIRNNLIS